MSADDPTSPDPTSDDLTSTDLTSTDRVTVDRTRHEPDAVSLMAGLLLVLLAGLFLLTDLTDLSVDGRWACPLVLIAVGVVGLVASVRSRPDR